MNGNRRENGEKRKIIRKTISRKNIEREENKSKEDTRNAHWYVHEKETMKNARATLLSFLQSRIGEYYPFGQ